MLDGLGGGVGDRLRGLVEGAREEGRRGVGWGMERLVVVGRKGEAEGSAGVGEGVGGEKEGAGEGGGVGVGGNGERSVDLPVEGVEQTGRKEERRRSGREKWLRIWKRLNLSR